MTSGRRSQSGSGSDCTWCLMLDQAAAARARGEPGKFVGDGRAGQVGPADDPGYQRVGGREGEHFRRLGRRR